MNFITVFGIFFINLEVQFETCIESQASKKIKQVDQIFENVWDTNSKSDNDPESLRISVDAKAKIRIDIKKGLSMIKLSD